MHSGCDAVGSHYVAPACPNDCRGGADCAQAPITSTRPCAWQPTSAANLRARMPHVFWANAAVVLPRMFLYLILSGSVEVNPNSLARRLGAMPLTFARAAPSLLRVTSACCDMGGIHACLHDACGANLAECVWQRAEHNTARCWRAARPRRHCARPRRSRAARAKKIKTVRNVFHHRRGRWCVSLLLASLPTVRICGQRQRDISCAWRGCARRGAAARHKHVRIFACVVRYVCEYIL